MAIVIPSKHIYDKDNNKIRDNKIDRIEVNATEITPNNEYETPVYNEDLDFSNIETIENTLKNYKDVQALNQGGSTIRNVRGACELKYKLNYITIPEILIPKVQKNKYISKIYDGKDEEGNPRIKIGLRIKQKNYSGYSSYQPSSDSFDINFIASTEETENIIDNFKGFKYEKDVKEEVSSLSVTSPSKIEAKHSIIEENNKLKISNYLYAKGVSGNWLPDGDNVINIENSIEYDINDGDIILTNETINGIEYYKLSGTKILTNVDVTFMSCLIENVNDFSLVSGMYRAVANRVYQEIQKVTLTVYGNTIGIDLTNKTVYIPDESGNKPFSIEGNELMQTSNYYTLKKVDDKDLISPTSYYVEMKPISNYNQISVHIGGEKNDWETYVEYKETNIVTNGSVTKTVIIPPRKTTHSPALKATGTDTIKIIRVYHKNSICSQFQDTLLEYSNGKETATILCDIYNYVDAVKFKVLEYELLEDGSVYCRLKTDNINDIYDISNIGYIYVNGVEGFVQDIDEEEFLLIVYFNDESIIEYLQKNEITINNNSNFYFNIGDVVIPMVYGANGVDKPMSKYKDGTPKKFKVLGTRIFYDGAVWQELTLQEK